LPGFKFSAWRIRYKISIKMSSTLKSSISGIARFNMFGKFFAYRLCYTENILYPKIKYEFFAKLGDRINPAPSCGVLNPAGRLFYVIQSPQQSCGVFWKVLDKHATFC
jgi:hypothetical protein